MPSLHFLLAAAKDGDRDALLGLQTGHQGHNQHHQGLNQGLNHGQGQGQHGREPPQYDENRSNGINQSNNLQNNNNLSNAGRQVIHGSKNSPTDWMISGGDTFRSTGPAADADLFSYQMPIKPHAGLVFTLYDYHTLTIFGYDLSSPPFCYCTLGNAFFSHIFSSFIFFSFYFLFSCVSRVSSQGNEGAYLDDGRARSGTFQSDFFALLYP